MQAAFEWIDNAPVLDLIYFSVLVSIALGLIGWAMRGIYKDRQYAKKRKRLIELAGSQPVPPADAIGRPLSSASDRSRQDLFDAEHSHRPRVGLTRRGK